MRTICVFRVLNPHKTVCWHYICLNIFIWVREWKSSIRIGVAPSIFSVLSEIALGIGWKLVLQSGVWSAVRTGVGRKERDLSVDASWIQRGYSGCWSGIDTLLKSERVIFYPIIPDHAIKIDRGWSAVWCEYSLRWCKHLSRAKTEVPRDVRNSKVQKQDKFRRY